MVVFEITYHLVSDGNWSNVVESVGQFIFVTGSNVVAAISNMAYYLIKVKCAVTILTNVGIRLGSHNASGVSNVLKSLRRKSTSASMIVKGACTINQLLLSEQNILSFPLDIPVCLQCSDGREGPARSTARLIFDGSDDSKVIPLESSGNLHITLLNFEAVGRRAVLWLHQFYSLELLPGHIREIVYALRPCEILGVMDHYLLQSPEKDAKPIGILGILALKGLVDFLRFQKGQRFAPLEDVPIDGIEAEIAESGEDQKRENQNLHDRKYNLQFQLSPGVLQLF